MKEVYEDLVQWGVEIERIHFECFGPSTMICGNRNPSTTEKLQIQFYPDSDPITWDGRSTLLDMALSNGLKPTVWDLWYLCVQAVERKDFLLTSADCLYPERYGFALQRAARIGCCPFSLRRITRERIKGAP